MKIQILLQILIHFQASGASAAAADQPPAERSRAKGPTTAPAAEHLGARAPRSNRSGPTAISCPATAAAEHVRGKTLTFLKLEYQEPSRIGLPDSGDFWILDFRNLLFPETRIDFQEIFQLLEDIFSLCANFQMGGKIRKIY